jgi:hypothetical protein
MAFLRWLLTLLCWDGALPAFVAGVPALVHLLRPPDVVEVLVVIGLPIAAFFWRIVAYNRYWVEQGESVDPGNIRPLAFLAAIFILVLLEALLASLNLFPKNGMRGKDWVALAVMYLAYLILMGVALWPVSGASNAPELVDEETFA